MFFSPTIKYLGFHTSLVVCRHQLDGHTTCNTHPAGEMNAVREDCLSFPPASSDTSDESYISDLVTN